MNRKRNAFFSIFIIGLFSITLSCQISPKVTLRNTQTISLSEIKGTIAITDTRLIEKFQPTYDSATAITRTLSIIKTNGGCKFPCLWGLSPQYSTKKIALNEFRIFGQHKTNFFRTWSNQEYCFFIVNFLSDAVDNEFTISCYDQQEKIFLLGFSANSYSKNHEQEVFRDNNFLDISQYFSIANILTTYGIPDKILIGAWKEDPIRHAQYDPFILVLEYNSQGFIVQYVSPISYQNDIWIGCPQEGNIQLGTWNIKNPPPLEKKLSVLGGIGINSINYTYFKEIQFVTNMSKEEFYQIFKNPNNSECIKTSASIWFDPTRK